jgi:hypothetical protein
MNFILGGGGLFYEKMFAMLTLLVLIRLQRVIIRNLNLHSLQKR